jgi:CheY-like chemotaxis protein
MTNQARGELTVLLAEDDENDVILIRRAVDRLKSITRLIVLPNGEQIIPYLRGEDQFADRAQHPLPDVVFLDQRMPRVTGLDVLFWLRTEPRFSRLPVVVLSNGFSPSETDMACRLHGACATKTMVLRELPGAIESGIQQAFAAVRDEL